MSRAGEFTLPLQLPVTIPRALKGLLKRQSASSFQL
jgi:hypothetical protein